MFLVLYNYKIGDILVNSIYNGLIIQYLKSLRKCLTPYLMSLYVWKCTHTTEYAGWKSYSASFACQNIRNMITQISNSTMVDFFMKKDTANFLATDFSTVYESKYT